MSDWKLPWEGECRCGSVRFRITSPPLLSAVCHCRSCQRMSASAFSTTIFIPSDGFSLIQGATVIGGTHGEDSHHQHCDTCKGWVFTTSEKARAFVNVRATLLDAPQLFVPFMETQTAERLP